MPYFEVLVDPLSRSVAAETGRFKHMSPAGSDRAQVRVHLC